MTAGTQHPGTSRYQPQRPIVMIGPMAVGKSVIGAELARVLGLDFVDTDQQIVTRHGAIPAIFAARGEDHFRQLEARAVAAVLDAPTVRAVVLSLGGGAVLDTGTQQLMARATVVYLRASVETVKERIVRNTSRPLLAVDPLTAWSRLAAARGPVYARLANITIDVGKSNVPDVVATLIDLLAAEPRKENTAP